MIRLLIIEDEWIVANFIAEIAQEQGFQVIAIAQSYQETKEILESHTIDCAIVDINLKGPKHGIDVATMLKDKKINFLFLSAYKDLETMKEAAALSPLSYLIKPASEEEIIVALLIAKNYYNACTSASLPFTVDPDGMIRNNNTLLQLSTSERVILAALIKNHNSVVSHTMFYELLWDDPENISEGTLRNVILKLRKKFDLHIENIKNTGYRLTMH
jgi:DNA-binding response OmpR family regulator